MMNAIEWRVALSLATVFLARMLGLFVVLPIFAIALATFPHSTPLMIGLAIGAYGLTQAVMQLPMGIASDRFGRKPIIVIGLLLFFIGSLVAANAEDFTSIITGRFLQGLGAVAAATMALAADLSREQVRARMMAIIGMSIGAAFLLSMMIGPWLYAEYGLTGIFYFSAALAILALVFLLLLVPEGGAIQRHPDAGVLRHYLLPALKEPTLLKLYLGVGILHAQLTALFLLLPQRLLALSQIPLEQQWRLYAPILLLSFAIALPLIIAGEKRRRLKFVLLLSIGALLIAAAILMGAKTYYPLLISTLIFFVGFNAIEALQPAMIARYAPIDLKGTAMGLYSTCQFGGIFIGGLTGGVLLSNWGEIGLFSTIIASCVIWSLLALTLPHVPSSRQHIFTIAKDIELSEAQTQLNQLKGVQEVVINQQKRVAYLKVDKQYFDPSLLDAFSAGTA